jgi:hypothetical protein
VLSRPAAEPPHRADGPRTLGNRMDNNGCFDDRQQRLLQIENTEHYTQLHNFVVL